MKFIDTHCHLYAEEFDVDREAMIARAIQSGVHYFLLPNIDSSSIKAMNMLVESHPERCFPMMGIHPTSIDSNYLSELKIVEDELKTGKYIAVGEIGIDLYWDKTYFEQQKIALVKQIELAIMYRLPVVIHMRDSFEEIMEVILPYRNSGLTGVFHCFTGAYEQAVLITELGFLLGIGGVATFKNGGLDKFLHRIPLEKIVLETDAPYLAPAPHRGKRNESSYIPLIASKVAEIYNIDFQVVSRQTTENAINLFNLKL